MPAGLSMSKYISYVALSLVAMFAGSQSVHMYYKPLSDLNEYIEREEKRREALPR